MSRQGGAWRLAASCSLIGLLACGGCDRLPGLGKPQRLTTTETPAAASGLPARPPVPQSEVIATVNGAALSRKDVELALQEARANVEASGSAWTPLPLENDPNKYDLPDLVDDLVTVELRAQDAIARGLDRNPEAQRNLYYLTRAFYAQEWLRWQLERIQPTQEEVSQWYEQYRAGYRVPEKIKVRQLTVDSEEKAKAALVKLLEGVSFVELAQQMSLEPDAARGALADKWVMTVFDKEAFEPENAAVRTLLDPALEQAAFSIPQEQGLSSYVKGPDGKYHIFQLVKRDPGREKTLLEVSDEIRAALRVKKLGQLSDELRAKATIQKFPERLEGISQ